jgi:hypothetical protein
MPLPQASHRKKGQAPTPRREGRGSASALGTREWGPLPAVTFTDQSFECGLSRSLQIDLPGEHCGPAWAAFTVAQHKETPRPVRRPGRSHRFASMGLRGWPRHSDLAFTAAVRLPPHLGGRSGRHRAGPAGGGDRLPAVSAALLPAARLGRGVSAGSCARASADEVRGAVAGKRKPHETLDVGRDGSLG